MLLNKLLRKFVCLFQCRILKIGLILQKQTKKIKRRKASNLGMIDIIIQGDLRHVYHITLSLRTSFFILAFRIVKDCFINRLFIEITSISMNRQNEVGIQIGKNPKY